MSRRKPLYATIGSISSLDPTEDAIGDLAYELKSLLKRCRVERERRKAYVALLHEVSTISKFVARHPETFARSHDAVDKLFEALDTFAPPYTYFGEQQGKFGFWPLVETADIDRLPAGDDHRDHWGEGDVMLVNDHGNIDCGYFDKRGQWHEYWAC